MGYKKKRSQQSKNSSEARASRLHYWLRACNTLGYSPGVWLLVMSDTRDETFHS